MANSMGKIIGFYILRKNDILAEVGLDCMHKEVYCEHYNRKNVHNQFISNDVTWEDMCLWFQYRINPTHTLTRAEVLVHSDDIDYFLEQIKVTHGRLQEDYCWVKFKDEILTWKMVSEQGGCHV